MDFHFSCIECRQPFTARRYDAKACSGACRTARSRRLEREEAASFRAAAAELLRDQTRAIIDGADVVVLAALERRAARLFGAV